MANFADYASLLEALGHQGFRVKPNQCVSVRNRQVSCNRCASACATGCISIQGHTLSINPENCIGCGTCATACPTGALATVSPTDDQIIDEIRAVTIRNEGLAVIACASLLERAGERVDRDSIASVPCLGRLDESMLARTAADDARKIILVADDCENCPHGAARATIDDVVASTTSILHAWKSRCTIRLGTTFPRRCAQTGKPRYNADRREFLLSMREGAENSARQAADFALDQKLGEHDSDPEYEHVGTDGTLPYRLPQRRARLMQALNAIGQPTEEEVESRLWRRVVIDSERCNGCQMCAVFCPSGALRKHQAIDHEAMEACAKLFRAPGNPSQGRPREGTASPKPLYKRHPGPSASSSFATGEQVDLLFEARLCLGCDSCRQLCPKNAITTQNAVMASHLQAGHVTATPLKDIFREKGGPDAIRNSMSKLIDSPFLWG